MSCFDGWLHTENNSNVIYLLPIFQSESETETGMNQNNATPM